MISSFVSETSKADFAGLIFQIGTGFKDEDLEKHNSALKELVIPRAKPYYRFDSSSQPDHWFEAAVVWEVKAADLSISPAHQAAVGLVRLPTAFFQGYSRVLHMQAQ